jgi:DNA ligase D-like protein (predicted 3'-phosphoesterase)
MWKLAGVVGLKKYLKKRNLKKSGEPKAIIKKSSKKRLYVIQEHHATRLHWDLRLEMNGVLKSWALPKIPPKTKGIKRLAVHVEDHPLAYGKFEGEIKDGYGKGTVKIWDKGTYELIEKDKEKIEFEISGKKLKGKYVLVNAKLGGEKKNWLFMKI